MDILLISSMLIKYMPRKVLLTINCYPVKYFFLQFFFHHINYRHCGIRVLAANSESGRNRLSQERVQQLVNTKWSALNTHTHK